MKHTMVNRKKKQKKQKNPQQKEQIINRIVLAKSYIMYMKFHIYIYIYNVEQRDDSNMHMPQIEFQFGKLFSV